MKTPQIISEPIKQQPVNESYRETTEFAWKPLYKIGVVAALAQIVIIAVQAPIFILYPQPTTVIGHFTQLQSNKLIGLLDLDLMLLLAEVFAALVLFSLYSALRRVRPALMATALTTGLGGIALFFAVNPTFSLLYLSDQYAAATTDAQRAALLAAGEALWANYNGTAFALFFILSGIAYLIIAAVMLRSGIFNKATAYTGILMGAMMLIPPLPPVGTIGLALSYIVIVPSAIWNILIAWQLSRLGAGTAKNDNKPR